MTGVDKIGVSTNNNLAPSTQNENNKPIDTNETGVKKYLTTPNVILGSLATIGVLGMADILICKGRHINKLTGKGKELEDALTRVNELESKATELETLATEMLTQSSEMGTRLSTLERESGEMIEIMERLKSDPMKSIPEVIRWLQNLYIDAVELPAENCSRVQRTIKTLIEQMFGKMIDYEPKYEHFFSTDKSSLITKTTQNAPAIVFPKSRNTFMKPTEDGGKIFDMDMYLEWLANPEKKGYFSMVPGIVIFPM